MVAANIQDGVSDDLNYEIWAPIAKTTLVEKGLWDVVENGVPPDPSKIPELAATIQAEDLSKWRDLVRKDMEALQVLQSSLTGSAFRETLSASSAKDVWDLLEKGNEQAKLRRLENQFEGVVADYEMLAVTMRDFTFDEDMWMIYTTTSNHMTPYVKFFTTLDRTHRARVTLANGAIIMAEGRGDVEIMTNEGKKTIKDVLFVPDINRNVLSVCQMTSMGYSMTIGGDKCTLMDQNRNVFGESMLEERGFALRFQVIEGNLTS